MKKLFTERHEGSKPRVSETLDAPTRTGLLEVVTSRIDEEWFGLKFPDECGDGYAYAGTDREKLRNHMATYGVLWPFDPIDPDMPPADGRIFDVLEYSWEVLAESVDPSYHSYMGHYHHSYDQKKGREKFASEINRIFERNGIAFELKEGEIRRFGSAVLHESLAVAAFKTGDGVLDGLLETSRQKFLSRSLPTRLESLEKLWDAWERLKTMEPGDKKQSVKALLDKAAAEPGFRTRLETEARELTEIGNKFMIRHTETDKVLIQESAHVDYLFQRMFSLIRLLLKTTGREDWRPTASQNGKPPAFSPDISDDDVPF